MFVIPAKAGIHSTASFWIPAFAGMTVRNPTPFNYIDNRLVRYITPYNQDTKSLCKKQLPWLLFGKSRLTAGDAGKIKPPALNRGFNKYFRNPGKLCWAELSEVLVA
jgi:hypothetical protein